MIWSNALLLTSIDNLQEDDCACPPASFQCTFNFDSTSQFTTLPETYTTKLPHHFHLALSPFALLGPSVLNSSAWQRYQTFTAQPQLLTQPIDYQLAAENLIVPLNTKPQVTVKSTDTLTAWLHLTEQCNLRCSYCYAPQSTKKMNEATAKQTIEYLFTLAKQRHCKRLKLKYAGGEPTLHFKLISFIHDYAHRLATSHDIELEEIILSNGVAINQAMADWLVRFQVKLMLSIDGIGKAHDQQRPTNQGHGSFQSIHRVLTQILLPKNLKPLINITVTTQNAPGIADIVEWVLQQDLPFHLNFYRSNQPPLPTPNNFLEENSIIAGMQAAYQVVKKYLPTRPFLSSLLDKVYPYAHTHPCGAGYHYVAVTATGSIFPCQMLINQSTPVNLGAATDFLKSSLNLTINENQPCENCLLRYRCAGGCPLETYLFSNQHNKTPNCHIYQTLYPQVLYLEGLRLIKKLVSI